MTDGVIIEGDKIKSEIEIKSYKSALRRDFQINGDSFVFKNITIIPSVLNCHRNIKHSSYVSFL